MPYSYRFRRPSVTVDPVIFGFDFNDITRLGALKVLLIKRGEDPYRNTWALPGGFVMVGGGEREVPHMVDAESEAVLDQGESLGAAAMRELEEETGIEVAYMEQLGTFGAPGRDPRGRVISVAYMALVRISDYLPRAGSDATAVRWFQVRDALKSKLAFDHMNILNTAVGRLQGKIRYAPIGFDLLPERFTMGQLQRLYEAILLRELDTSNFAKRVERVLVRTGIVVKTGRLQRGPHRPAPLYRFDKRAYYKAVRDGLNFQI